MLNINSEMEAKLTYFNKNILNKYSKIKGEISKKLLVKLIKVHLGNISPVTPYAAHEIPQDLIKRGILGVDGSINTLGSSYPHYISVLQAMAKSTIKSHMEMVKCDIHSPLMEGFEKIKQESLDMVKEGDEILRAKKLATLEMEVCIEAMKANKPSVVLLDGSLTRYKIYCDSLWEEFRNIALENNIYVGGIIEEIKTNVIYKTLKDHISGEMEFFDREILFGVLEYGQVLVLNNYKGEECIRKCFMRTSLDPHVIGIDMLCEQVDKIHHMAKLVFTLTPKDSRGIPLWLDIVDAEVKISDKMLSALVETYIDPAIKSMLFTPKREKRVL